MIPQPSIRVLYEPAARPGARLGGASAVVIDAIRATTTIVLAVAAGCREIIPFRTEAEVRAEAARRPAGTCITVGERLGMRIEGFDFNNSPSVITPQAVAGRTILLTTTNGTQAIHDASPAAEILVAAMPNRRAVARRLLAAGRPVVFVAAGTVGTVSCEDTLVAGAVIDALLAEPGVRTLTGTGPGSTRAEGERAWYMEDSALVAVEAWRGAAARLLEVFSRTWGGAYIIHLGLEDDLRACAQVDTTDVVPVVHGLPPVVKAG